MSLITLPDELLLAVVDQLKTQADANALARVSRRLYNALNGYLYRRDLVCHGSAGWLWSVMHGIQPAVARFLALGTDVQPPGEGYTALGLAALRGHGAIVRMLLDVPGVDENSRGRFGRAPISLAAEGMHLAVVSLLLQRGHDPNVLDNGGLTPLCMAAGMRDDFKIAELLLQDSRIDVNRASMVGLTPLAQAATSGQERVTRLLLAANGIEVDKADDRGETPLMAAARWGSEAAARLLIEDGRADLNRGDGEGQTALCHAVLNGHEAVAKLLLDDSRTDPNCRDRRGRTPLWRAVWKLKQAMTKLLISDSRTDVDIKNSSGWPPLVWASRRGHDTIVADLLERGADPNATDPDGCSPIWWAASRSSNGADAAFTKLVNLTSVDANLKDSNGRTPLIMACMRGNQTAVKLLLARGVDRDAEDEQGMTALRWATQKQHWDIAHMLEERQSPGIEHSDCCLHGSSGAHDLTLESESHGWS